MDGWLDGFYLFTSAQWKAKQTRPFTYTFIKMITFHGVMLLPDPTKENTLLAYIRRSDFPQKEEPLLCTVCLSVPTEFFDFMITDINLKPSKFCNI